MGIHNSLGETLVRTREATAAPREARTSALSGIDGACTIASSTRRSVRPYWIGTLILLSSCTSSSGSGSSSGSSLSVTPSADFINTGAEGGPFTPGVQIYTVRNDGEQPLNWEASCDGKESDDSFPSQLAMAA